MLYFEPLRVELNDCFGCLKDVSPDQVFSNRKGLETQPHNADSNGNSEQESNESMSQGDSNIENKKKKTRKSKLTFYFML